MQTRILLLCSALVLAVSPARQAGGQAARDAVDRARTKVVILKILRSRAVTSATGFLAAPGLVVTARHAVQDAGAVTLWLNGVSYPAETVRTHLEYDLALLRLRAPDLQLKPVTLARRSTDLRRGEELVILAGPSQGGAARGEPNDRLPLPARFRNWSYVARHTGGSDLMLTLDAGIRLGDSGSPVLRASDGTVVGVATSRRPPEEGGPPTAYAVPVEALTAWLHPKYPAPPLAPEDDFYLFQRQ